MGTSAMPAVMMTEPVAKGTMTSQSASGEHVLTDWSKCVACVLERPLRQPRAGRKHWTGHSISVTRVPSHTQDRGEG